MKCSSENHNQATAFLPLTFFGIAMGVLEAIVVVYLRQLYYPSGFDFPLHLFSQRMLAIEWIREIATIIMLIAVGWIAGKNSLQRFAYFLFSFAIWDIFYYITLKALIDWPASLLTWDLLFLIPVAWVGPVLAPIICSFTMIWLSVTIVNLQKKGYKVTFSPSEWILLTLGALLIFCSFIWDYTGLLIRGNGLGNLSNLSTNETLLQQIAQYRPTHFNWLIFSLGEVLALLVGLRLIKHHPSIKGRA
jgi:hypothetical protein